jgi:hypothetical protein
MNIIKKLLITATVFLVGGCATKWNHPNLSENDFYRDRATCNQEAQSNNPSTVIPYNPYLDPIQQAQQQSYNAGANMGTAIAIASYFNNCMMAKGYRKS